VIAAYATPVMPARAKTTKQAAAVVGSRRRRVTRPAFSALAPSVLRRDHSPAETLTGSSMFYNADFETLAQKRRF
jgi:hypothetical protein